MSDDQRPPPPSPMTAERLRQCLEMLGWTQGELARRLGVNENNVRQWARGRRPVPREAAVWIESMARIVAAVPEPIDWKRRRPEPEGDEEP